MGAAVTPLRRRSTVRDAAAAGRRELLVALRDKIASEIDSGDIHARDLASLSRRLVDISEQLEAFDDAADGISVAAALPDEEWSGE